MSLRNDARVNELLTLTDQEWEGLDAAEEIIRNRFPTIDVYDAVLRGGYTRICFGVKDINQRRGHPIFVVRPHPNNNDGYVVKIRIDSDEVKQQIAVALNREWDDIYNQIFYLANLAGNNDALDQFRGFVDEIFNWAIEAGQNRINGSSNRPDDYQMESEYYVIAQHFMLNDKFKRYWRDNWSRETRNLFIDYVQAIHNRGLDWYFIIDGKYLLNYGRKNLDQPNALSGVQRIRIIADGPLKHPNNRDAQANNREPINIGDVEYWNNPALVLEGNFERLIRDGYWPNRFGIPENPYEDEDEADGEDELIEDISSITEIHNITETQKETLINARIKQGYFRRILIERYKACCVSGVTTRKLLRASHIKPWVDCDNNERLHPDNGLLLSIVYDALFDKGFISFRDDGLIIISEKLSEEDMKILNISHDDRIVQPLNEQQKMFLDYHRQEILIKPIRERQPE
jgi:hypothetical protein